MSRREVRRPSEGWRTAHRRRRPPRRRPWRCWRFGPWPCLQRDRQRPGMRRLPGLRPQRSEEHTSELQSPDHLVCRLLLEKKKKQIRTALFIIHKKIKDSNICLKGNPELWRSNDVQLSMLIFDITPDSVFFF